MLLSAFLSAHKFPKDENTPFGVTATRHDLIIEDDLQIPTAGVDGKIPTLNQTGFMTPDQNPYNQEFMEFAVQCIHPVLDVGAAYGLTSLPPLHKGATVIANDIDERHLLLLRAQAKEECWSRLYLNKRRFPHETKFPDQSLGAIMLCRVVHFLTGDEMEEAITKTSRWLVPGGRIYVITMSPYHHLLTSFLSTYIHKADAGVAWPGVINNMHDFAPHQRNQIPNFLHVMETRSLGTAFRVKGLTVVKEGLFDYMYPGTKKSDGKGYYGIIVEKTTQ